MAVAAVEENQPVYWSVLFNGDNRDMLVRWLRTRCEKAEVLFEDDGNLAVPVTFLKDGSPENRIFEKVYPGEYVMVRSTGGVIVVEGETFFNDYVPYTGNQYENYGGKMSLIEIPAQLKVPEVFWCVKYDGTNGHELSQWVDETTFGEMKLVLFQRMCPRLEYTGSEKSGTLPLDKLTPGDWLVASPEHGCRIVTEEQLHQSYAPVAANYNLWKEGKTHERRRAGV